MLGLAKYRDRPAAVDVALCGAAYANRMTEDRIERALEGDNPSLEPLQKGSLHPENHGEGRRMGRAISIGASSPVVVLPRCFVIDPWSF